MDQEESVDTDAQPELSEQEEKQISDMADQEEDEYESLVFEGVEYQKNKEDDILDPEDSSVMGVWKDGTIEWEDDEAKQTHESKKISE